jgi:hypothetical protein
MVCVFLERHERHAGFALLLSDQGGVDNAYAFDTLNSVPLFLSPYFPILFSLSDQHRHILRSLAPTTLLLSHTSPYSEEI